MQYVREEGSQVTVTMKVTFMVNSSTPGKDPRGVSGVKCSTVTRDAGKNNAPTSAWIEIARERRRGEGNKEIEERV